MKLRPIILICLLHLIVSNLPAQQSYNLQSCIKCALEKNHNLKKSRLDREKSIQAGREMMGALLPQINASANGSANGCIRR
ncbi:MAG: TolC family protein, partial [Paludibacter sp.]|nr:TolC family protein [Paludibacter sp.]